MAKILVVEDDKALRETLAYNLGREEHNVQAGSSSVCALRVPWQSSLK